MTTSSSDLDVKICGLSTPEAVAAAAGRGASHVGFIHFPKSPRHLTLAEMADLCRAVPEWVRLVVVLVDPDDALVDAVARDVAPAMLQLHGHETPERVAAVRTRTGLSVMKAVSIGSLEDVRLAGTYAGIADRLLFDAKRPKGSALPGGNGVAFDWGLLAALDPGLSFMLSGGLDASNVGEALRRLKPTGIDVSSGVETAPGVKDVGLIHGFFDAVAEAAGKRDQQPERSPT